MNKRLIIGIASAGRPQVLSDMLARLVRQTLPPDRVILAVSRDEDVVPVALSRISLPIETHLTKKGTCLQRNFILQMLAPDDLVVFLDDDFVPADDYLEIVRDLFDRNPSIVMATGRVLADGILGPGITFEQADRVIQTAKPNSLADLRPVYNGYGCNMAIRARPVVEHKIRFDERLLAYGWLEDVDFSRQLARHGQIVMSSALSGVHLGTKASRSPGAKLGYSQVANPIYLASKGTMARHRAGAIMLRNLGMNLLRSFQPEPWVDRRGRLRGNLTAFRDLLAGRLSPERAGLIE